VTILYLLPANPYTVMVSHPQESTVIAGPCFFRFILGFKSWSIDILHSEQSNVLIVSGISV